MAFYKETIVNTCEVCGKHAEHVKVANTKASKQHFGGSGMFWRCEDGHYSRTRKYEVKQTRLG